MDISYEEVGQLLRLIEELECETVTLEVGELRLHVSRSAAGPVPSPAERPSVGAAATTGSANDAEASVPVPSAPDAVEDEGPPGSVPITAPMVGTFYRASSPDEPPFVEVGASVEVGQQVGIVEVMKLMNELTSTVAGRVSRIDVENAEAVGYGRALMWIEPA